MAETITPGAGDRVGTLARQRDTGNDISRWTTAPGFQFAKAVDLIKDGKVYKTIYTIYGEAAPGANYNNATIGSKYCNLLTGAWYERHVGDDGTAEWMASVAAVKAATGATTNYTDHPAGGVLMVNTVDATLCKYGVEGADNDAHLY